MKWIENQMDIYFQLSKKEDKERKSLEKREKQSSSINIL